MAEHFIPLSEIHAETNRMFPNPNKKAMNTLACVIGGATALIVIVFGANRILEPHTVSKAPTYSLESSLRR